MVLASSHAAPGLKGPAMSADVSDRPGGELKSLGAKSGLCSLVSAKARSGDDGTVR